MRERVGSSRSKVIARLRCGDLVEGLGAIAALLIMLTIGMPVWLSILLAMMTYAGATLMRPQEQDGEVPSPSLGVPGRSNGDDTTAASTVAAARFGLTPREWEILPSLAQRLTDREIAERYCISYRTAEHHSSSILAKLGLGSRRDVAGFCRKHGLLPPDTPPSAMGE